MIFRRVRQQDRASSELEKIDEHSTAFLLAEYTLIRESREFTTSLITNRMQFVVAVQTGAAALLGVLLAQSRDRVATAIAGLAIGLPIALLTHLTFLRAVDSIVVTRRYLRALNAIRGYFVARDRRIAPAIVLPTSRTVPGMQTIGAASSVATSGSSAILVLGALQLGALTFAVVWLAFTGSGWATGTNAWRAVLPAVVVTITYLAAQGNYQRRVLRRADRS